MEETIKLTIFIIFVFTLYLIIYFALEQILNKWEKVLNLKIYYEKLKKENKTIMRYRRKQTKQYYECFEFESLKLGILLKWVTENLGNEALKYIQYNYKTGETCIKVRRQERILEDGNFIVICNSELIVYDAEIFYNFFEKVLISEKKENEKKIIEKLDKIISMLGEIYK